MDMHDQAHSNLIDQLVHSYAVQAELYRMLAGCVQKTYGQLVLSRGDLSRVTGMFAEKQRLLNAITGERERIKPVAEEWRLQKAGAVSEETGRLDAALAEAENAIRIFLDIEQQLERYLKRLVEMEGGMNV